MSYVPKYPNNFYLFYVFQFKLTLEVFYSILKTNYPFGYKETCVVILTLHTKTFSPRAEHAEQVSPSHMKGCIRGMQRSKNPD